MRTYRRLFSAALLFSAAGVAACDSPSGPTARPEGDLVFVRAAANAPPLETQEVRVWAKAGEGRRVEIKYQKVGEYGGDRCLEFDIPGDALATRPDGTPFAKGDSILITIRVIDPAAFRFDFQPSGLKFSTSKPAELRLFYGETDDDLNGDGTADKDDDKLESTISIWRQEKLADPWEKVGSLVVKGLEEVRGNLTGFTRYALAY